MFGRALLLCVLLTALVVAPSAAQSTLPDDSVAVVTSEGVFLVANQVTVKYFDVTDFGGTLNAPSITWIDGTNVFIVTTSSGAAGVPGGVWRMTLNAGGMTMLDELTSALPAGLEPRFADADYSPGLDTLFLLQRDAGQIVAWAKPAQSSPSTITPWGEVPPGDARSIAVLGAKQPFAIVAALESGPVLRVEKLGTQELYATGAWNDIATNPVTGDIIVAKQIGSVVGQIASATLLFDFNVGGMCGPLVAQPSDVEWDPVAGRAVAIAGEALPACAFGGLTTGENHVVQLPLTASGGGPNNVPKLLTPEGDSGITGSRADFALVRHGGSEVTYWGYPSAGAGTSEPTFKHQGPLALNKTVELGLGQAPPSAAALLVLGLFPSPIVVQGQLIVPAPQALMPAVTSASGAAELLLKLPAGAVGLVGLEVYMQWVADDTTTAAGGDIVSSQLAVFTVGVK